MSDKTDKTDETKKIPPRVLSEAAALEPRPLAKSADQPRLIPSGLNVETYVDTRIRKFEPAQAKALRLSLKGHNIESIDGITGDDAQLPMLARFLGACLCKPANEQTVVPQLHRKGNAGVAKLLQDLTKDEIVSAMKLACQQCAVFDITLKA